MKTKINIICVLIFVAIVGSFFNFVVLEWHDFVWGVTTGWDAAGESKDYNYDPNGPAEQFITLLPKEYGLYSDSIYNEKTAEMIPVQYREVVMKVKEAKEFSGVYIFRMLFGLIAAAMALLQLIVFIRFIVSINKSIIFDWSNVVKLRTMGYSMLIQFAAIALHNYIYYKQQLALIELEKYKLTIDMWDFYSLIPGLGVLLIAEVFAFGLKLREEQELTI